MKWTTKKTIVSLALVSVLAAGAASLFLLRRDPDDTFLDLQSNMSAIQLDYKPPILRPAGLEIGSTSNTYIYSLGSLVEKNGIITYQLINKTRETIQVTIQKRPAEFIDTDYPGRLQLNTTAGKGVIGENQLSTSAALFTKESLVFIKAQAIIDDDTLRDLLGSFTTPTN